MTDPAAASIFRGKIRGHDVVLTVGRDELGRFGYTAEIDGLPVDIGRRDLAPMLSKGDAMQLGLAAVEAHVSALPQKR
ncbi:hypothetical protein [uncultured Stenotrophomonas sp.]|uniref:hypothetical protein n=1 Tax=uncultured Stenotrophomonas sp. TaxID=165438 RepID=UPI0028E64529|nr:hypothetical protein [uncultured Stenotrophomonas sp.]